MGFLRTIYFKITSEDKLRKKANKMFTKLKKVGFYEKVGNKHMGLANKYNDYLNAIGSKMKSPPPREHGWNLYKK